MCDYILYILLVIVHAFIVANDMHHSSAFSPVASYVNRTISRHRADERHSPIPQPAPYLKGGMSCIMFNVQPPHSTPAACCARIADLSCSSPLRSLGNVVCRRVNSVTFFNEAPI
ncbi:hypothetical protein PENSPDRAFT_74887 [Peniophora sp. CONT]|nr:hypothetical protein PENSPDRAFT_74887 [Peniophora sp. CONT]